jgi:hypothetical protein
MSMSSKASGDDDSSHAMRDSYGETSGNQFSAHQGCQDMLLACVKRSKKERRDRLCRSFAAEWKIADLGSTDGSNSIRTIDIFLDSLKASEPDNTIGAREDIADDSNLHIVFEEHPSSDETKRSPLGWKRRIAVNGRKKSRLM